jgi:hypothetical protein
VFRSLPAKLSGGLTGLVRAGVGIPQMGATVLLFNHEDRLFARVLTDEKGGFSFLSLIPDVYSVRVSLRSFVPVFRDNIVGQPGVRSILNVNRTTLFSTIRLVTPPAGERALMTDDCKIVLRTKAAGGEWAHFDDVELVPGAARLCSPKRAAWSSSPEAMEAR